MSEIPQVLLELAIYFAIVGVVGVCTWVELKHEHAKRHQREKHQRKKHQAGQAGHHFLAAQ